MLVSHPAMGPHKLVCVSVCRAHCASFCVLEKVWRLKQGHEESTESEALLGYKATAPQMCAILSAQKDTKKSGQQQEKNTSQELTEAENEKPLAEITMTASKHGKRQHAQNQ